MTSSRTPVPQETIANTPTIEPTIPASINELPGAELPPGFSLIKFAMVPRPTAFAFDAAGRMYVTSQDEHIYLVTDANHDGRADDISIFASGYIFALGVAIRPSTGEVYVSHQGVISVLRDTDGDNQADQETFLAGDLPYGKHQNDNLEFGPDGWLYIGLGSTCNACEDSNPLSASILRFNVDTGDREVYASGLRNPYDLAFQPGTGELFSTDNGRDDLGMDAPFEELNHIVPGGDYGYPNCWNAADQPGCEETMPAVAFFEAHSSADGVDFYNGPNFPAKYDGNAFVTIFGSWLKSGVQTGIQRVVLSADDNSSETSWFVRFPTGVMPLPIISGPDGGVYVGDYVNGVIYRISYGVP
ncbi:MAG TPA: PQQ-dependent sugar dehydrogenase [Anaerolineales bacterium]|nr:PQQ-dependent sugar dehydrogenase [Anaerolineales bacterium]